MFILTKKEQIEMMEGQLNNFDTLFLKLQYLKISFDNDPMFDKESIDIVRGNITKTINDPIKKN